MGYADIITIEPGKRSGKPCIRGLRITVYDELEYLASGMTHQKILADFRSLTEIEFPGSQHVAQNQLDRADDTVIREYAETNGLLILSKTRTSMIVAFCWGVCRK